MLRLAEADVHVVGLTVVELDADPPVVSARTGLPVVEVLLSGGVVPVGGAADFAAEVGRHSLPRRLVFSRLRRGYAASLNKKGEAQASKQTNTTTTRRN